MAWSLAGVSSLKEGRVVRLCAVQEGRASSSSGDATKNTIQMQGSYTVCFLVGGGGSCPSWRRLISSSTSLLGLQYVFLVCSIICAFFGESAWDVVDAMVSIRYSPVGNLTRAWPRLSWTSSLAISFARSLYVCRGPSTCSYFLLSTIIGDFLSPSNIPSKQVKYACFRFISAAIIVFATR